MTKIAIHKDQTPNDDGLWWKPWMHCQKQINEALVTSYKGIVPSPFCAFEQDSLACWQQAWQTYACNFYNNLLSPWDSRAFLAPYVHVFETSDNYKVKAILCQDIKANEIDIWTEENVLTIKRKTSASDTEDDEQLGRTIALPSCADTEHASSYLNGNVIYIEIPKKKTVKEKRKAA